MVVVTAEARSEVAVLRVVVIPDAIFFVRAHVLANVTVAFALRGRVDHVAFGDDLTTANGTRRTLLGVTAVVTRAVLAFVFRSDFCRLGPRDAGNDFTHHAPFEVAARVADAIGLAIFGERSRRDGCR